MVGYSLNDTIIIFDRVRENLRKFRRQNLYEILNLSINETLPRSVLTHGTTMATTIALVLLAGEVLRPFALVRSEEHTSELQSLTNLVCRLLLEKKKTTINIHKLIDRHHHPQ